MSAERHSAEQHWAGQHGQQPPAARPRPAIELTEGECWRLLASTSLGRVVFTQHAMPAIRPVNHFVDGRKIVIRTHNGAAIASRAVDVPGSRGSVVCYEADEIDPVRHTGWSVIVTGLARLVTDPADLDRYTNPDTGAIEPWIAGEMNQVVVIEPQIISGRRLVGWCD